MKQQVDHGSLQQACGSSRNACRRAASGAARKKPSNKISGCSTIDEEVTSDRVHL